MQGEPLRARSDCVPLIGQAGLLVAATCIGSAGGLSGQAESALQAIEFSLAREPEAPPAIRIWALTQAAEIAERLGDLPRATEHYATALAASAAAAENDVYLKAAHADFLLDQHRAAEVKILLAAETDFDPLLLRLALAEDQLADRNAAALHLSELLDRYALAASRGDPPHRREQAMAALYLQRDAKTALLLAQQKLAELREPADAVKLVTAFTIAHAVTLCLTALGVVSLPSRVVESLVALSVLFAGFNNLLPLAGRRTLFVLAWVVGLIHGTAIAGARAPRVVVVGHSVRNSHGLACHAALLTPAARGGSISH